MSTYEKLRDAITGKEAEREVIEDIRQRLESYRHVFLKSDAGRGVLASMLVDLNFFDECETPEEVTRRNFATKLLFDLGILRKENVEKIVMQISGISTNIGGSVK